MALVLVHASATLIMVGVIWFVQVVHYPLFASVGADAFVAYENANTRLTGYVVGPPMVIEGVTALWLVFAPPTGLDRWVAFVALGVLGVITLATVAFSVPAHSQLSSGWDAAPAERLVTTNWIRTVGWTLRGGLALWMIHLGAQANASFTPGS